MNENKNTNLAIKILLIIAFSSVFAIIALSKIKFAVYLGFGLLTLSLMIYFFGKIKEKKFFLIFIFIYPILPWLWGFYLASGLPVLRTQRIACIILIIYMLRNGLFTKYFANFFKNKLFTLPILFIILSMLFSSLLSIAKIPSIFYTVSFILEYFIISVVVYNGFQKREEIESLLTAIIYSALVLCSFGLYERIFDYNIFLMFGTYLENAILDNLTRAGGIRIKTSFTHPISFGAYLAMILPLAIYKYRNDYKKFFLALGLIIFAIMSTQSRSAQIGAGIACILYFIFIEKNKLTIALFASFPVIIFYSDKIFAFLQELNPFTATDAELVSSTSARILQFNYYFEIIKSNFLFGYGMETIPAMLRDLFDGTGGFYDNSIDNFYLGYAFHFGIIGLIAWLYLMLAVIIKPILLYGKTLLNDKLLLTILISCIIFNIINYIVFLQDYHYLFWIYLGIIARLMTIKKEELAKQTM